MPGLTSPLLLPLAAGFKQSGFRPLGWEGALEKLEGFCTVVEEAVAIGHRDLARLILARDLMERVTRTCRSSSELMELFLSRPLMTVPLGAKLLQVSPKAVDLMLAQLSGAHPRELTCCAITAPAHHLRRLQPGCQFCPGILWISSRQANMHTMPSTAGRPMIDTLIIADDLSGAADCAAACVRTGVDTVVILDSKADPGDAAAVAVDVDSRAVAAPEAGAAAADAVQQLCSRNIRILYQKMDSTLRGHWAAELPRIRQAAAQILGHRPLAIVAPAFPETGRVTIDGHVFVNKMPLEGTELWKRAGLRGSADPRTILTDVGLKVGQAALEQVALGPEALRVRLTKACEAGCDAVVCDAQTDEDLATLAAATLGMPEKPLWVGSAGLMRALARAEERKVASASGAVRTATGKPIVAIVGSASEISHLQFAALAEEQGVISLIFPPSALTECDPKRLQIHVQAIDRALASGSDVAVAVRGEGLKPQQGAQLTAALAELIAPRLSSVGGLIVTGGETARAVLVRAGIAGLNIRGEIEPGVPAGLTIGTRAIPVITKAGAFGDRMTLVRCRAALRSGWRGRSSPGRSEQ